MSSSRRRLLDFRKIKVIPAWSAWIAFACLRLWRLTLRVEMRDAAGVHDQSGPRPVVFALWHNRLLFIPDCFPAAVRRSTSALISASRDGGYATAIVGYFGLSVVRGSSSRGGRQAVRELLRELRRGQSVVLTVDGPRGPRYEVQHGVVQLARLAGVPVVPLALNARRRWELKSWDRTQLPCPFSRVVMCVGEGVDVSKAAGLSREEAAGRVRDALLAITDDRRAGEPGRR
jgi:lysophospholipid acyltransferase (LPLAT)-like uncharacterized protein